MLISAPLYAALPPFDSQGQTLPTLAPMLEKVTPAVVNISTTGRVRIQQNPLFSDPFFRHFFETPNQPRERITQSLGSGVIVDAKKGYILTNNHVIDKADEIRVTLRNGETHQAKLIGTDPDTDVAVIQIKVDNLTAIPLADSTQVRVGDFGVAIGNPFGLGQTVTSGIISAIGRSGLGIEGFEDFIQTDASINPGNSGGALVNLRGELIGINTAILSKSGGNVGIGFAIPVNMANDIMQQLLSHGEVRRGQLGAQAQDLTPQLAKSFGLKYRRGAVITQVEKGLAADRAGLKAGDIVLEINGKTVRDSNTLRNTIGLLQIGKTVTMKVLRDGKTQQLQARVEEPSQTVLTGKRLHKHLDGAELSDISEGSRLYGRVQGILINKVEASSPAAQAGLRAGDVLTSINRRPVRSLQELQQLSIEHNQSLLLNILRGNTALFLYIQ
ncbi:MAG: DegQ family serine endoprotease [Gammaproteobacteria bacterium]|nr:DegQ family serine endoprotease [Gammaproteobacteria bacterium]